MSAAAVTGVRVFGGAEAAGAGTAHRYEYVFRRGGFDVYDIDAGHSLAKQVAISSLVDVRGACVSPVTDQLYISFGNLRGHGGSGRMLRYDLASDTVVWTQTYPVGVDSMAITLDGGTIYMPVGENTKSDLWYVLDAGTGAIRKNIAAGSAPHNTVVGLDNAHVYLGGKSTNYLEVVSTSSNAVVARIGPLYSGVRPFSVNGKQTLAFTTATKLFGFEVSDIAAAKRLFTVGIPGFSWDGSTPPSCPCHGISLSPDETEVWVLDHANRYVHVFDTSPLPSAPPVHLADIAVSGLSGKEAGCLHDCQREGWLHHSRDGAFVYVGDSGDVISTATRTVAAHLPSMGDSRIHLEIDVDGSGSVTSTTTRYGLGYVT
jgi:DNA-binding beta-propeller fold protein YncE